MEYKIGILLFCMFLWVICGMALIKQLYAMVHERGILRFFNRAFNVTLCLMLIVVGNTMLSFIMRDLMMTRYANASYSDDPSMQCARGQVEPAPWKLLFPLSM